MEAAGRRPEAGRVEIGLQRAPAALALRRLSAAGARRGQAAPAAPTIGGAAGPELVSSDAALKHDPRRSTRAVDVAGDHRPALGVTRMIGRRTGGTGSAAPRSICEQEGDRDSPPAMTIAVMIRPRPGDQSASEERRGRGLTRPWKKRGGLDRSSGLHVAFSSALGGQSL